MEARGKTIRSLREAAGYGLNKFADRVGISPSWLSRIERNQSKQPSPEVLKRIADGLKHPIDKITDLGMEDPE